MKKRMTQRAIKAEQTKNQLYTTAILLFQKNGYENVTIDDICSEVGLTKGAFYNHFPSKSSIIEYSFKEVEYVYTELYESIPKRVKTSEKLLRLCMCIVDTTLLPDNIPRARIVYGEEAAGRSSCLYNPKRNLFKIFYKIIDEGKARGQINPRLTNEDITGTLFGFVIGSLLLMLSMNPESDFDLFRKRCETSIKLIIKSIEQ